MFKTDFVKTFKCFCWSTTTTRLRVLMHGKHLPAICTSRNLFFLLSRFSITFRNTEWICCKNVHDFYERYNLIIILNLKRASQRSPSFLILGGSSKVIWRVFSCYCLHHFGIRVAFRVQSLYSSQFSLNEPEATSESIPQPYPTIFFLPFGKNAEVIVDVVNFPASGWKVKSRQ